MPLSYTLRSDSFKVKFSEFQISDMTKNLLFCCWSGTVLICEQMNFQEHKLYCAETELLSLSDDKKV